MALTVGSPAPLFTLRDTDTNPVNLSDYKGKPVVVLFFPLAFTGVCTTELCSVRDDLKYYEKLDTQVLAISVDSPFTLKQFKESQSYNFPLLSDFNKNVSRAYGSIYDTFVLDLEGVSKRSAFVVDGEGVIRYAEVLDNAGEIPNFVKVKEVLESL